MLRIQQAQMEELDRLARIRFEKQLLTRLRAAFPERTQEIADPQLRALATAGTDKALHYGLNRPSDIQRFVEYTILFGSDFDKEPTWEWMRDILEDESLTGSNKIAWIDDEMTRVEEH